LKANAEGDLRSLIRSCFCLSKASLRASPFKNFVTLFLTRKDLEQTNYITSSCNINNNTVYKNGKPLFANNDADIQAFFLSVYKRFEINYSRFYKMDNLSKLGWLASEILLKDSFKKDSYSPEDIGLILSNANSSLDTDQKYMAGVADVPSPSLFVYTLPNIVTGEICIRNNFKGELSMLSKAL